MKAHMDDVSENDEILIVSRPGGKSVVMISMDQYNALNEMAHLTCSDKNADRLSTALAKARAGKGFSKQLME